MSTENNLEFLINSLLEDKINDTTTKYNLCTNYVDIKFNIFSIDKYYFELQDLLLKKNDKDLIDVDYFSYKNMDLFYYKNYRYNLSLWMSCVINNDVITCFCGFPILNFKIFIKDLDINMSLLLNLIKDKVDNFNNLIKEKELEIDDLKSKLKDFNNFLDIPMEFM